MSHAQAQKISLALLSILTIVVALTMIFGNVERRWVIKSNISGTYHSEWHYQVQTNKLGEVRLSYPHIFKGTGGGDLMKLKSIKCKSIEDAEAFKQELLNIELQRWEERKLSKFHNVDVDEK